MSRLERLLNGEERILWSGRPVMKAFVLPALASIPFGLFFLAFAVFWMANAPVSASSFFLIFGAVFILVAIAIALGPSLWQLLRYRNTEYMITDKRILTQTGAIGLDTRFVDFDKIQEVYVKIGVFDRLFGTGSLYAMTAGSPAFGPSMGPYQYGFGGMYGGLRPSLAALKKPYEVQKLLQEAVERSKTSRQT